MSASLRATLTFTLLVGLILLGVAVFRAPLNQDEGWYLLAARRVSAGEMPYRDFAFTQAPLLPHVYAAAKPWVRHFGLAGGRAFTALWSVMGLTALLLTLRRRDDPSAGGTAMCVAAVLLLLNPLQAQYSATVKTYSLAGCLLTLGLCLRLRLQQHPALWRAAICGLLLAAATATRISLLPFLPALTIELWWGRRRLPRRLWLAFALGGGAGLLLFFAPFAMAAPEGFLFGLWEFHHGRELSSPWLLRAGFASRSLAAALPSAACLLWLWYRRGPRRPELLAIGAGWLLASLLHAFAAFPYDEYQVVLAPALVLCIAAQLPDTLTVSARPAFARALAVFGLLFTLSSAQLAGWFSGGHDRIWWRGSSASGLRLLQETATVIRKMNPAEGLLLTQDSYLAVEAGLEVPRGLELGPFAYFPAMDSGRAARLQVMNEERLLRLFAETPATLAAFSGYGLSIASPEVRALQPEARERLLDSLGAHFESVALVEGFGQAQTPLLIYRRRTPD